MGIFESLIIPGVENIAPDEANRRFRNDPDCIIVDVRQPAETSRGTIPGAVLIPLTEFSRRFRELPKDRPIITICWSGHRSPIAARRLKKAGYRVTNVTGGIQEWGKLGLELTRPDSDSDKKSGGVS